MWTNTIRTGCTRIILVGGLEELAFHDAPAMAVGRRCWALMSPVQEQAPSADGSDQPGSRQPAGDCKDIEMQLEDVHMKNLIDHNRPPLSNMFLDAYANKNHV